jgi:spore coat protein A, manganese oxidase
MKRRTVLRAGGALLGLGVAAPLLLRSGEPGQLLASQAPRPESFRLPLAVPPRLMPVRTDATTDYYEITQQIASLSILPGLTTSAWTYNGTFPGPTVVSRAGRRTVVRHTNTLPEPVVVHLHGGHTPADSDGYPVDLLLPSSGYDMRSMHGDMATMMRDVKTGTRDYTYPMQQRAATLWYHDHHMGATGPNVWRGLAGFHLVDDDEDMALPLPRGKRDIPLMITDRSFAADGSLRYAAKMNGLLGDVALVNGVPWPVLAVDPVRYRLRLLNASNARRYRLELDPQPDGGDGLVQIGADGGLLIAPIRHDSIDIAPAERFDVIVDFSRYRPGTRIRLLNRLGSGRMAEVMRFDVTGSGRTDESSIPQKLSDVRPPEPSTALATRDFVFRQATGNTWTVNDMAYRPGRALATPRLGTTEIWRFTTDFHHPVHLHLNHFQVLSRNAREPGPFDAGWKDTVDLRPAEAIEVAVRFTDYAGTFLLHCHNLEHEDMAMMADFVTA